MAYGGKDPKVIQINMDTFMQGQFLNVKVPLGTTLTALKGDGSDETTAFQAIIQYASQNLPMTLFFPNGTYGFTDLGNIAYKGLTILGATDRGVVFKCLNTATSHTALKCDAFWQGLVVGYVRRFNIENIIVEGNSETEIVIFMQGLAQCSWKNVYVRGGKQDTTSKGFHAAGIQLMDFTHCYVSNQQEASGTLFPYYGIYGDIGYRAGVATGASSNNNFYSCYFEGPSIGIHFENADQNQFFGGASESCIVKGLEIKTGTNLNRYNTFIGTGFENDSATIDVDDGGMSTQYINCYSSKYMKLNGHRQKVSGGMFNTLEVTSTAIGAHVENVKVNYFGGTGSGFIDGGVTTKWRNLWNNNTSAFMYPSKARTGITVTASPFTWVNNTGNLVQLFIGGGTVSGIQVTRNGANDPFSLAWNANVQPMMVSIAPNDGIIVTYTSAPGMSYRELNGF